MKSLTETEKAYAAGIIDGEGCIGVYGSRYPRLVINVCSTSDLLLAQLRSQFGGHISALKRQKSHHKDRWNWSISSCRAADCIRTIQPYLFIKREEAAIALKFIDAQRSGSGRGSPRSYSDDIRAHRLWCAQELKRLKHDSPSGTALKPRIATGA